jgi:formylglycine-generating enzyme
MKAILLAAFCCSLTYTAPAQSTDFMPMVYVEGGSFKMGSDDKDAIINETPVHTVTLTSFWIGKYEVTVAQYRTYCAETGTKMPEAPSWGWNNNDPIVKITRTMR